MTPADRLAQPSPVASAPRTALVTGSSAGIGHAVALALLQAGWQVLGVDRQEPPPDSVLRSQPGFTPLVCDLLDAAALHQLLQRLGGPSAPQALVHAAGQMFTAPLGALPADAGRQMWALHVDVAQTLANALVPAMQARGFGRVVLVGSRVAQGAAGRSQYAACKAALLGLARSWALECVAQGVTVNVVAPAATRTGLLAAPERSATPPKLPPIGRLIEPAEVAALVAYLLSDAAAPITGQELMVCGGASL